MEYKAYNHELLLEKVKSNTTINNEVVSFFNNFTFNNVLTQNAAKGNSTYVFKNAIKEDTTKSKITQALNKLHAQNLTKIVSSIREIVFQNYDELSELVSQCIYKIKRDSEQTRPVVAALCNELQSTYFLTADNEKIYFRRLLLTTVKKDYIESLKYDDDLWSRERSEKSMILIGTLFNTKLIEKKILVSIINDLENTIKYKENEEQEYFSKVEKAIQQFTCLISVILPQNSLGNTENNDIFIHLLQFLEENILIYEDKKCISKKIRIVCKNSITEITNYLNK